MNPLYASLANRKSLATSAIIAHFISDIIMDVFSVASEALIVEDDVVTATEEALVFGAIISAVLMLITLIVSAVMFSRWFLRAAHNTRRLHGPTATYEYTPGWCVGYFFVPIANFYRPLRAMREVWQASDPNYAGRDDFRQAPIPDNIGQWWGFWIGCNIAGNIAGRTEGALSTIVGILSTLLTIAAGLELIRIMRTIGENQEAAWRKVQSQNDDDSLRSGLSHVANTG